MHAVYLFYAKTNDLDEIVEAFDEWINDRGDDNNWYTSLCAINSKGQVKIFVDDRNHRGLKKKAEELLKINYPIYVKNESVIVSKLQGYATIEDFKMFAWDIAAYELSMCIPKEYQEHGFLYDLKKYMCRFRDIKELEHGVSYAVLSAIKTMYSEVDPQNPVPSYKRRRLVWLFENILMCPNLKPFVSDGTPYDFRCFDITDYISEKKGEESILSVNIHT